MNISIDQITTTWQHYRSVFHYLQSKWLKAIAGYEWELRHVFIILDILAQNKLKEFLAMEETPHICVFNHCYLQPIKDTLQQRIVETHISAESNDHYRLYTWVPQGGGKIKICKIYRNNIITIRQPINLSANNKAHYINRVWRDVQGNRHWPTVRENSTYKNI